MSVGLAPRPTRSPPSPAAPQRRGAECLREFAEKAIGLVLTVSSGQGRALAVIPDGDARVIEVSAAECRSICWSTTGPKKRLAAPPQTRWLRVVRSGHGHTTTLFRCYAERPPALASEIRCKRGHAMERGCGMSGIFRAMAGTQDCGRCAAAIRNGVVRWICQACSAHVCFDCVESEAWSRRRARSMHMTLDDFLSGVPAPSTSSDTTHATGSASPRSGDHREICGPVPLSAERPSERLRADAVRRICRLLEHGDAAAARRAFRRAAQLGVPAEGLERFEAAIGSVCIEDEFTLLRGRECRA